MSAARHDSCCIEIFSVSCNDEAVVIPYNVVPLVKWHPMGDTVPHQYPLEEIKC